MTAKQHLDHVDLGIGQLKAVLEQRRHGAVPPHDNGNRVKAARAVGLGKHGHRAQLRTREQRKRDLRAASAQQLVQHRQAGVAQPIHQPFARVQPKDGYRRGGTGRHTPLAVKGKPDLAGALSRGPRLHNRIRRGFEGRHEGIKPRGRLQPHRGIGLFDERAEGLVPGHGFKDQAAKLVQLAVFSRQITRSPALIP